MRNKRIVVTKASLETLRAQPEAMESLRHHVAVIEYRQECQPPRGFVVHKNPWLDLGGEGAP